MNDCEMGEEEYIWEFQMMKKPMMFDDDNHPLGLVQYYYDYGDGEGLVEITVEESVRIIEEFKNRKPHRPNKIRGIK